MKVVIDDTYFDMPIGKRLLKNRYPTCIFPEIQRSWDELRPMGFREILETITDPRQRAVAIHCLPLTAFFENPSLKAVSIDIQHCEMQLLREDGSLRSHTRHVLYDLFAIPLSRIEACTGNNPQEGEDPVHWFIRRYETDTEMTTIRWIGTADDGIVPEVPEVMASVAKYIRTDYAPGDISRIIWSTRGVECVPRFGAFRNSEPRSLTVEEYIGVLYSTPTDDEAETNPPKSTLISPSTRYAAPGSMDPTTWRWTGNLNSYIKVTCFLEPEDRALLEGQIWFSNHTEGIIGERLFHFKSDGILCLRTVMLLEKIFRSMHSCIDAVREQVMWPHRQKLKSSPIPMRYSTQPESVTRPIDLMSRGAGSVLAQFGKEGIEVYVSVY